MLLALLSSFPTVAAAGSATAPVAETETMPAMLHLAAGLSMARDVGPEYHIDADGRGANPRHDLALAFTPRGALLDGSDGGFALRLERFGRGDGAPVRHATPRIDGAWVEYDRGTGLREWFVNLPQGVEQGWTVAKRPEGTGPLVLELDTGRPPERVEDGRLAWSGLVYRGLVALDAEGRELPSRWVHEGARLRIEVDDSEAVYPVLVDPWVQEAKLTASDGSADDFLGRAVALSDDTALVGAPFADVGGNTDQGAAYVFTRSDGVWSEQAKLTASDGAEGDQFGGSVALSGTTALVGASRADPDGNSIQGAAWVFTFSDGTWSEQAKLTASDGAQGDSFGWSVALSGDTALVGAMQLFSAGPGAAYVFTRDGEAWSEQAKLTASDGADGDNFGWSVALSSDTALVGAMRATSLQGAAYVFTRSDEVWSEQAQLTASDGAVGDRFGWSVALSGDTALVGAPQSVIDIEGTGVAYSFVRSGEAWSQQAKLTASDGTENDNFGWSVALSGDTALVGARRATVVGNIDQGVAYIFTRSGEAWSQQQEFTAADGSTGDLFGSKVALSSDTALVGTSEANAAYAFILSDDPGDPNIRLDPTSFSVIVTEATMTEKVLALHNVGAGPLDYNIETDAPWLSANPAAGTVDPFVPVEVTVTIDATDLTPDDYEAHLDAASNDPDQPLVTVPLDLTVIPEGAFPEELSVDDLDGGNGFKINGGAPGERSGVWVSDLGDVNSDGFDDFIIGAFRHDGPNGSDSGRAYVVFGRASGDPFPTEFELADLDGSNGFKINGEAPGDELARAVNHAGDVNGDGMEDFIIAAPQGDQNPGRAYVIFGRASGDSFPAELELVDLDGSNGFKINTETSFPAIFHLFVSSAKDINSDGIDDLLIGPRRTAVGAPNRAYVVFGRGSGDSFPAELNLVELDGSSGFKINTDAGHWSILGVSGIGDINDDGIDDIAMSSWWGSSFNSSLPRVHVVFGRAAGDPFPAELELGDIDGTNGFKLTEHQAPLNASSIIDLDGADINGDGIRDLIISVVNSGRGYVVFGRSDGFPEEIALLSDLDGDNGFMILFGSRSSSAGDVNGDGLDDLVLGPASVIFGRDAGGFPSQVNVASLDGDNGFRINNDGNPSIGSVSGAGDVNGDGVQDILLGSSTFDTPNGDGSGRSYVIFGRTLVGPNLRVTPDPLDFGEVSVDSDETLSVTLRNGGTDEVTVSDLTSASAPFAATGGTCGSVPFGIAPASSCTLDYSFHPTAGGPFTATVTVTSDAQTGSEGFDLVGEGVAPEPQIDVDPTNFSVTLESGQATTETLTIANLGDATLEWEVTEDGGAATGTPPHLGRAARARTERSSAVAGSSFEATRRASNGTDSQNAADLASVLGEPLPSRRVVEPANGLVDCDEEPGIIIHDDGTVENGYSGNPGTVTEVQFVDAFTPSIYPASFSSVCVAFLTLGPTSLDFELVVFDDDGADGSPGTELGSLAVSADGIPDAPGTPVWFSYDISSLDISIDSGSVYIGMRWMPVSPAVFVAADESTGNPPGFAGGYWWNDADGVWAPIESVFSNYRSLMVRATEGPAGPVDCTLPDWVSIDPVSGSLPADESQVVEVTFDATSLELGEFEAQLCLSSNDPVRPLAVVPLTLTVTGGGGPVLSFEPMDLDFGNVEVGDTSPPRIATLTNTGGAEATGLSFSGLPDSGFEADTSSCGDTLPTDGSCEVSITFTPAAPGPAAAALTASSAEGASANLSVEGNGSGDGFTPMALGVDPVERVSDGNGVFEPQELVDVAPTWRNDGADPVSLTGTASDFVGPDGADYTLSDADADYGLVDPGAEASCQDTGVCYRVGVDDPAERPATHWEATFDETLSDDTTTTWSLHIGDSFPDVPRTSPFYASIETLLHHGVTEGCTATAYCPAGSNTRAQMAVFLLKAAEGADYTPPACEAGEGEFPDVPTESMFCPWIEELAARGVTSGCGGGNYCPADSVTRAQMAVFLLKAAEGEGYTPPDCAGAFTDVPCPSTFANWIEDLANRGITSGCSATTYCPGETVTRAQMAVFLSKAFGLVLYGP